MDKISGGDMWIGLSTDVKPPHVLFFEKDTRAIFLNIDGLPTLIGWVQADHDTLPNPHHTNSLDHADTLDHSNANDHAQAHTPESHTGQTATAAQLNELKGGGQTTLHSHAGGGSSPITVKALSADDTVSTIALAKVTNFNQVVGVGTWAFKYLIRHQAPALTTGIRLAVNHSGTVTSFVWITRFVDVSAAASTAAQDQDAILSTGSVVGAFASRNKFTTTRGTTLSVDTINADMLTIIEGLAVVTVSGNLELWHGSEVAAATVVKANSALILTKIV